MPIIVSNPPAPIQDMLDKSWTLPDQQASFNLPSFSPAPQSVSAYVSPWLVNRNYTSAMFTAKNGTFKQGIFIQDQQISNCLMNQALDYLQRAVCNAVGHYLLALKGLETWARVTNYYASYFAVHSLLCLQGRTITRLQLDSELQVVILPLDIRNHIFGISQKGLGKNPHHVTPWRKYYDIYDRYAVSHSAYERVVRKANVVDPMDESVERNALNYAPFTGFQEVSHLEKRQDFLDLFTAYVLNLESRTSLEDFLNNLQGYASDPECQYFARTLLKISLAADIILSIRSGSPALQNEWETAHQKWRAFLEQVFPPPSDCYLLKFIPLVGQPQN